MKDLEKLQSDYFDACAKNLEMLNKMANLFLDYAEKSLLK